METLKRKRVKERISQSTIVCALPVHEIMNTEWSAPKLIESSGESTYAYTSVTFHQNRALLTYYVAPNHTNLLSLKFKSIPLSWFRE